MANKVQGEGDYAAARRYNEETRKFVKDKEKAGKAIKGSAEQAVDGLTCCANSKRIVDRGEEIGAPAARAHA